MRLSTLLIAARLLDPRLWRLRLKQLGGVGAVALWVWIRAVQRAPVDTAVRDARHVQRRARIQARNAQLEAGRVTLD